MTGQKDAHTHTHTCRQGSAVSDTNPTLPFASRLHDGRMWVSQCEIHTGGHGPSVALAGFTAVHVGIAAPTNGTSVALLHLLLD